MKLHYRGIKTREDLETKIMEKGDVWVTAQGAQRNLSTLKTKCEQSKTLRDQLEQQEQLRSKLVQLNKLLQLLACETSTIIKLAKKTMSMAVPVTKR